MGTSIKHWPLPYAATAALSGTAASKSDNDRGLQQTRKYAALSAATPSAVRGRGTSGMSSLMLCVPATALSYSHARSCRKQGPCCEKGWEVWRTPLYRSSRSSPSMPASTYDAKCFSYFSGSSSCGNAAHGSSQPQGGLSHQQQHADPIRQHETAVWIASGASTGVSPDVNAKGHLPLECKMIALQHCAYVRL